MEDFIRGEEKVEGKSYKFVRRDLRRNVDLKHSRANCYMEFARFAFNLILRTGAHGVSSPTHVSKSQHGGSRHH